MKLFITLFSCLYIWFTAAAQYPKLIVQLRDKGSNTFSLSNASLYLSQRAIQRRLTFNIAIDSLDLPLSAKYIDSIRSTGKVTILSTSKWLNQVLIETTDQNAVNKIRSLPFVKAVGGIGFRSFTQDTNNKYKPEDSLRQLPSSYHSLRSTGNKYDYENSYAQVHIHQGEFLHNKGFSGETIHIAVLDAGFQNYKSIGAFDSIRINGQVLGEKDFVSFDNSVNEDGSHGMHCLSILSANWPGKMVGTAPKANYWLVRTETSASEYPVEEHNWVVGAEFADSSGTDLISTSLGYNTFDDPSLNHNYTDLYRNNTMVSKGAAIAVKKGMIVSASAGNEGGNGWKYITFPADADSVCAVGSVNSSGVISGFSSWGYPGKIKPNIVSVGSGTVVAGPNNEAVTGNGTSYSNPNVAGLIACLWQAFPRVNNMKILDAVYKSADRYQSPDLSYGYGIPDFKIAYRLLKHDENIGLYGNEWLFAAPSPFTSKLDTRLIGKIDGPVTLSLLNNAGKVLMVQKMVTEKEEVYNNYFSDLGQLAAGFYSIKYTDSITSRVIPLQKGNIFEKDWLVAIPNPFSSDFAVFLKAQESGAVMLRLVDTKGSVVETLAVQVLQNETNTIHFKNVQKLPAGVFFLQYIGRSQKRTIRVVKGESF